MDKRNKQADLNTHIRKKIMSVSKNMYYRVKDLENKIVKKQENIDKLEQKIDKLEKERNKIENLLKELVEIIIPLDNKIVVVESAKIDLKKKEMSENMIKFKIKMDNIEKEIEILIEKRNKIVLLLQDLELRKENVINLQGNFDIELKKLNNEIENDKKFIKKLNNLLKGGTFKTKTLLKSTGKYKPTLNSIKEEPDYGKNRKLPRKSPKKSSRKSNTRRKSPKKSSRKSNTRRKSPKKSKRKQSTTRKKMSGRCEPSLLKKYINRKSPKYPAQNCKGHKKKGNDGEWYISKSDKNGIYRWKKI